MKCHMCGSAMSLVNTDLPFKVSERTIVIVKGLPVYQCNKCPLYELEDHVMGRVDEILARIDSSAELEVVRFAA